MPQPPRLVHFGVFEADLEARELRKHGMRIHMPEQAFRVLAMLVERPGEVVNREKLKDRLWPDQTFVDFDHGLNKAVNRLRDALGDAADNPRFIETAARRGYRFLVPVTPVDTASHVGRTSNRVLLAVLPFENLSADANQEFFSDGLTEEMISELGRLSPSSLGVIARTSVMPYKRSPKPIDEIGRELKVDYVLEGSVRRVESRVRITAQLIDVRDQTHLWAESYNRELADIFNVQLEVAQRVAGSLAYELLPRPKTARPVLPQAHEAYLQGRFLWNKGSGNDAKDAVEWFRKALEYDSEYALAYSGIANCYGRLTWFSALPPREAGMKAKEMATQALRIDEQLGEAHASMALVRFWYEWNWPEAEKEFRCTLELKPNYADAHNWYAAFLNVMGRFDEAAAEQKIAEELDPLSLIIAMNAAEPHYFMRRYDQAIELLRNVLKREPRFFPAYFNRGAPVCKPARAKRRLMRSRKLHNFPITSGLGRDWAWLTAGRA